MTGGFYRLSILFRLDLQLLLAVDAAILAVGAQLEDLVTLFLDGGDAAGVLAPHDVDQTLGGLGLFLLDSLAVLDDGHADVGVFFVIDENRKSVGFLVMKVATDILIIWLFRPA